MSVKGGSFHHVGIACVDLDEAERTYGLLGYGREDGGFDDPGLGIRGRFLVGAGPRLELVADRDGAAVVKPWLDRGAAMYHLAFVVDDLAAAVLHARDQGAKLITGPVPAVAFGGRSIAFVVLRNRALVELIAAG